MAGHSNITPISHCYGCLSSNKERQLQTYFIKKLIFKTILQVDHLVLCYYCRRIAIQTEKFIHNVETSQAFFADSNNTQDLKLSLGNYKTIMHPLVNLSCIMFTPEDTIVFKSNKADQYAVKDELEDISFNFTEVIEIKKEEVSQENENCINSETITTLEKIFNAKEHEDFNYTNTESHHHEMVIDDGNSGNDAHDDDFIYSGTKQKQKKEIHKDFCAGVVTLTKEQLEEERALKSMAAKYVDATFKCKDCVKGFVMRTPYENHMKLHDKKRGDAECDICKQRLKTASQLEKHYQYHVIRYKCSKCDDTRNCLTSLKDHYLRKHSEGHFEYSCPVCFRQFRFRSSLQKHKADKHDKKERLKCRYCDKTFASESAIGYHLKFKHTEEESAKFKPHTCSECGRSFRLLHKLKAHMVSHSNVRDHYCVECDKSFKTRTALNLHFKTVAAHNKNVERDTDLFTCSQCDKRLTSKKGLLKHIKAVHLNQTYQCSICGKTFKSKKSLRFHIYSHEGYEQPKKYCCTICNKRFNEQHILRNHMNIHTGEKPFQCSQCPAQFAHSGSRYTHIRLVHLNLTRKGTPKGPNIGTLNRKPRT